MIINPQSVERSELPDGVTMLIVTSEVTMDDGSVLPLRHRFPWDTLEWRAAEYDIPAEDADTLLDIVLHEPMMDEPDRPDLLLHDARTVEEARAYHLSRVEKVKGKDSVKPQKDNPVMDQIKAMAVMNPEAIKLKKAHTDQAREERAKQRLRKLTADPEAERLAGLHLAINSRLPSAAVKEKKNG